jgi:hypothetical protein
MNNENNKKVFRLQESPDMVNRTEEVDEKSDSMKQQQQQQQSKEIIIDGPDSEDNLRKAIENCLPVELFSKAFSKILSSKEHKLTQVDIYNIILPFLDTSISKKYLLSIVLELVYAIRSHGKETEDFIDEFLVILTMRSKTTLMLNILAIVKDSNRIAKLLITVSSSSSTPNTTKEFLFSFGLDMLNRLEKYDQVIELLLSRGRLLECISFVRGKGLLKFISPKQFFDRIERNEDGEIQDELMFYNIFRFMEQRNIFLHNSSKFNENEGVGEYVALFNLKFK